MTEEKKRKRANINIRLDPKIRFGLELLARKQRRNLSSVVTWVIHEAINGKWLAPDESLNVNIDKVWHTNEFERLKLLKIYHPELLTYEEELLLKELDNG